MGKIIDYFMRRKPLFLALLFVFGLSSASSYLAMHHHLLSIPISSSDRSSSIPTRSNDQTPTDFIAAYQQSTPSYILENKKLDSTTKSEILSTFYQLDSEQQKPFDNFIATLQRGGTPRLSYTGALAYPLNTSLRLADLINAYDNEDGTIEFNDHNLKIDSELDTSKVGNYNVIYTVYDQDLNSATLTAQIQIYDPNLPTKNTTAQSTKEDKTTDKTLSSSAINTGVQSNQSNTNQAASSGKDKKHNTDILSSPQPKASNSIEVPALGNTATQNNDLALSLTGGGTNKISHTALGTTGIFQAALQQAPSAFSAHIDPLTTIFLIATFAALILLIRFVIVHYFR